MDQQVVSIIIGIAILAMPIFLIVFITLYWRSRWRLRDALKQLTALEGSVAELTEKSGKLEAVARILFSEKKSMEERFKSVIDVDAEREAIAATIVSLNKQAEDLDVSLVKAKRSHDIQIEDLRAAYAEKKQMYDRLVREVAIFDERLAFAELGVYEPHFDFSDSEVFRRAIEGNREEQKRVVSAKSAVICHTQWSVEGSSSKGQTMINRGINLTLRAFNNECDAAIANARWNNVNAMEKRIQRAFDQINKLNKSMTIEITARYLNMKLQELYLTHEYREKQKSEKEERAELARAAREELKLQRDLERAEEEEARYQKLLEKAKLEAESSVGPKLDAFNEQIKMLERDLAEAHAKVERAQAMAEKTRSGYVYIISNVGSFGEDVVKIGLTRRLDPTDRVRELGDASVPFLFDTHAIIYSDNAPTLERALHSEFEAVRINTQNYRKEFFRASIEDVEKAVKRLAPDAPFFRDIEAQEYRETLAKRNAILALAEAENQAVLPESI